MADTALRRVLLVAPNFPPVLGGAQRWALEVALRLPVHCQAFEVLAPAAKGSIEIDRELPFTVHRCFNPGDALAFSGILPIRRIARTLRPTAILAGHWSGAHAALRATGGKVPVVSAIHGREVELRPFDRFAPAQAVYDRCRAYVFRHAAGFACVSRFTGGLMARAGVEAARIHVVPNGVDAQRFAGKTAGDFYRKRGLRGRRIMLTVARLVRRKGADKVIEALPEIAARHPDVSYAVIGSGPDRARLEEIAARCKVSERVHFLGDVSEAELEQAYAGCYLFVMPARSEAPDVEGFGLVFLEAGACGKPVIGSTDGGIPDAVVEGETGLLVDAADHRALAAAANRILGDAAFAARLGAAGVRFARDERGWDKAVAGIAGLLAAGPPAP
jgi:phosphatidyl-myo-inositol dimannoside synthase